MFKLLLHFFILTMPILGFSADVIVIATDSHKVMIESGFPEEFKALLGNSNLEVKIVDIADFNGTENKKYDFNLDPDDRIIGLAFHAHGTKKKINLHPEDRKDSKKLFGKTLALTGDQFGNYLADNFPLDRIGDNFFVHFASCSLGGDCGKKENFQDSFYRRFLMRLEMSNVSLNNFMVLAFTHATAAFVHNNSETLVLEKLENLNLKRKALLRFTNGSLDEQNIDSYLNSPLKKTLSWNPHSFLLPGKASLAILGTGLIVAEYFGFGTGLFAAAGLHIWGTYNGLIRRSSVRVRGFTSEGEVTERGALKKIFKDHIVGTVCSDLF